MSVRLRLIAMLALGASACGDDGSASPDAAAGIVDAGAIDGATTDADTPPIADAAPQPDAIPGFTCNAPIELAPGQSSLGNSAQFLNTTSGSCSPGSQSARDVLYRVPLPTEPTDLIVRVVVDEDLSPTYDAVVSIQTTCGNRDSEVACSDFGFSESVEGLALTDEAFVIVDGTAQFGGASDGSYQLDVSARSIRAEDQDCDPNGLTSRCDAGLLCSGGSCVAESAALACAGARPLVPGVVAQVRTHAFQSDLFQGSCAFEANAGAGEAIFAFSLAQDSDVDITTDLPGTEFDTVLYLRSVCEGAELACADDIDPSASNFRSRLQVQGLAAGDYLVFVDGASSSAPTGRVSIRLDATLAD